MIQKLGDILADFVFPQLVDELNRQGHKLTGELMNSFEVRVRENGDEVRIEFLMLKYGLSLNYGIKPSKIPYTIGGPPRGGTSKYIKGLMEFARKKFNADKKKAKAIAFAIAYKHKKEGYPLTKKIAFMDNVLKADRKGIEKLIQNYYEVAIELLIKEFIEFEKII